MDATRIQQSIAYCGLICALCSPDGACGCRTANHCGKRQSPDGCYQYTCCRARGLNGCWQCPDFCCGKDMFDEHHLRLKTFVKCIREDGMAAFAQYIARNHDKGIQYHLSGITGDYDLDTEAAILRLLRTGERDEG